MEHTHTYSAGDSIVHSHYGLGQVKGLDVKDISGEKINYCRIETTDSTFWIPVDKMDSDLLRRLSTPEEIQEAIAALERRPKAMSSDFKTRQSRIRRTGIRNKPEAIARLIRDLRERQRDKGPLNATERSAFRSFKKRLIEEWAAVTGVKTNIVESSLNVLLDPVQTLETSQVNTESPREAVVINSPSPALNQRHWATWVRKTN